MTWQPQWSKMNQKVWDDLISRLEDKFGDISVSHRQESRTDDMGNKLVSEIDFVEFEMNGDTYRVDKITAPLILDKKTHYTHTAGARASVEYVLSEDETTTKMKVYREEDGEFIEIQTPSNLL